jgi:RNA polymerase sigma factor (sigma-70 family)
MNALHALETEHRLEEFLERMRPRLRSLVARYRIPLQDAEDLLQQSLLALVYRREEIRNPEAWLLGTLRKTCLLYWRDRRRQIYEAVDGAILEWLAEPQPPGQEREELWHDLENLMARLPERCRTLLRLRYRVGLDAAEVAARLGYRPSSIGKVTARCLAAMAREVMGAGLLQERGANAEGLRGRAD